MPAGGVRPPLPLHLHSQTDGASRPGQPRSYMPGMDNNVVIQGKDDNSGVNPAVQEVADASKKVCGLYPCFLNCRLVIVCNSSSNLIRLPLSCSIEELMHL